MKVVNQTQQSVIADQVDVAATPWTRMCGLLGRACLPQGQGLLITQCNSIHMFFMRFPIDVIFLDRSDKVVGFVKSIPPFALSPVFWSADKALELPAGTLNVTPVAVNDKLGFEES